MKTNYMWWMAGVFLLLAATFIVDIWGDPPEIVQHAPVDEEFYSKKPVRTPALNPVYVKDGQFYRCNDCHSILEPSPVQKSYISAHSDVILDHGVNNYCTTCHSPENREKLLDINGYEVGFHQSQKTCLQCHGPIYRDWEAGVHGRMNDYWDEQRGDTRKLTCVECHNPHQPKFQTMKPSPAPTPENYRSFLQKLMTTEEAHAAK